MTFESMMQQQAVEAALEADRVKSLRDVFAASALGALIVRATSNYYTPEEKLKASREAYDYADAMLEARKK